ncbi:MAG: adenylate/guanylate cyclase domain-containing protein [Elusimicrobia bacterium]|nr:adenylate/guanylate cyclase domain-containing protein [Elusimicrobiota bacterium]
MITEFSSSTLKRRMATVMFLDMAGYSALISKDESLALECARELNELLHDEVAAAGGRIVKLMGDGSTAEFPDATAAVLCAQRIQKKLDQRNAAAAAAKKFQVRIGLHLGELIEERGDLYGESVNVAASVQPLADPGGIAMTAAVHHQIADRPLPKGLFLPEAKLKNMPVKMPIFLVPPATVSYPLWAFWRRGSSWLAKMAASVVLALALTGVILWFYRLSNPPQMTLVSVQSPQSVAAQKVARDFSMEMAPKGKILEAIHWKEPAAWKEIFDQQGLDLITAMDRLEAQACELILGRGLRYPLMAWIEPVQNGLWRLDLRIFDVKRRRVEASFSTTGNDARELSEKTIDLIRAWAKESL